MIEIGPNLSEAIKMIALYGGMALMAWVLFR